MGAEFLQLKSILNTQHKISGSLDAPFIGPDNFKEDLKESFEWLKLNNFRVEAFETIDYRGCAFATEDNLDALWQSGHFVLIDSTHKTNKYDWKLYTLLIQNSCASWLPGGHFLVSGEEQVIIAKGLQIIKQWSQIWIPRYFIIDLSSIEENALNIAFPGLQAGEQEVGIFYCTWHSRKALQQNLQSFGDSYDIMLQAMYKLTRIGCEQLIQNAIAKLPLEQKKKYISRNWLKNLAKWALWSRQHSPLLLQTTSTSPVESYHAVLK